MLVPFGTGLLLFGLAHASAVYVGRPDEPRYRGHVQRIEVFVTSNPQGMPRVALRFHHPEGSFAFVAEGPSAPTLLTRQRKLDLTRYIYVSCKGQVLEFRDRLGGGPAPPFSFTLQPDAVLPVCFDEKRQFLRQMVFLGDTFTRDADGRVGPFPELAGARSIILCDDLFVGTSRNFRNRSTTA